MVSGTLQGDAVNQQLVLGSPDEKFRDVLNKMSQHHLHRLYITGGCLPVTYLGLCWLSVFGVWLYFWGCSFANPVLCTSCTGFGVKKVSGSAVSWQYLLHPTCRLRSQASQCHHPHRHSALYL